MRNIKQIQAGTMVSVKGEHELAAICRSKTIARRSLISLPYSWLAEEFPRLTGNRVGLFFSTSCPCMYAGLEFVEGYTFVELGQGGESLNRYLTILAPPPNSKFGYQLLGYNNPMGDWSELVLSAFLDIHKRLSRGELSSIDSGACA